MSTKFIERIAEDAICKLHRSNSDQAVQSAIELMLTDHSTAEVVTSLRHWADYLEERK